MKNTKSLLLLLVISVVFLIVLDMIFFPDDPNNCYFEMENGEIMTCEDISEWIKEIEFEILPAPLPKGIPVEPKRIRSWDGIYEFNDLDIMDKYGNKITDVKCSHQQC